MTRSTDNPWLTRYAVLTALATLLLICVGGVVTSKGVGMSVPDWPTTYGYNMFFFPFSKWVGGIFYEHSHRLVGSAVGLMTGILWLWLFLKESRPWLRRLGGLAFVLVVVQGVLGGMRVEAMKDELGIFHATLAQLFFVLIGSIALFLSRRWQDREVKLTIYDRGALRYVFALATGMIFLQLILGATMRHQHAGLAIPDFPTAYESWWPATDSEAIARYNAQRQEETALNPITAVGVILQMTHRLAAGVILGLVIWVVLLSRRVFGRRHGVTRFSYIWLGLVIVQASLGAATIWTGKSADIATAHVAVGAMILAIGSLLSMAVCSISRGGAAELSGEEVRGMQEGEGMGSPA